MKICYFCKRRAENLLWILLLLVLSNALNNVGTVAAEPTTVLSVEPASIIDETLEPGDTFSVNITISDVENLGGFEFTLIYNTTILTATEFTLLNGTDDFFAGSYLWYLDILDIPGSIDVIVSHWYHGVSGTGAVATVDFMVDAVGEAWLNLTDTEIGTYTLPSLPIEHDVHSGYFDNRGALPPVASFTHSPRAPIVNETITFDATKSSSPGGGIITSYEWNFGDGETGTGKITTHAYAASGTYTVNLTVTDEHDHTNSTTKDIEVIMKLSDVLIVTVTVSPTRVTAGQIVSVKVEVKNDGTSDETFNVTVRYDGIKLDTQYVRDLPRGGFTRTLNFLWDTTGVAAGTYTIVAEASTVAGETDTANNIKEGGTLTVEEKSTPNTPLYIGAGVAVSAIAVIAIYFVMGRKWK